MPRHTVCDASAVDASVHLVADRVLDELVAGDLEPCLLHVSPISSGLELGVKPLAGLHPSQLLLGFCAPPEWYALGMAVAGWAYGVADRAVLAPRRERVHVVTLLTRSGEIVHRTRADDDADPEVARALTASADEDLGGEQIDLLRLALELPTDPPPCDTDVYWTIEWLSAVIDEDPAPSTWTEVMSRHPALTLHRHLVEPIVPRVAEHELVELAASFARVADWTRLRELVIDGTFDAPGLAGPDARWLDDGAFARYVLTRCPALSWVRDQAADHLGPELAARLDDTLDELGVPDTSWPDDRAA